MEPQAHPQSVPSNDTASEEKTEETLTGSHCPGTGGAWTCEPDLVVGFHE